MSYKFDIKKSKRKITSLKDEFDTNWRAHLIEISRFVSPRKGRFLELDTKPNDGKKRQNDVINGEAIKALRILAAGMQSGLTPPMKRWWQFVSPIAEHREDEDVKRWLNETTRRAHAILSKSNFYNAVHSLYGELGAFGTAAMLVEKDFEKGIMCYPFTAGEFFIAAGPKRNVDTFARIFPMQARNIVAEFGKENVSHRITTAIDKGREYDWFDVKHIIEPNLDRDPGKIDNLNMAYISVYFEALAADEEKALRVSGYKKMPVVAPRWSTTGSEVYGRSPAMEALGDTKMLQAMERVKIAGLQKEVDPPMTADPSLKNQPATLIPGGLTYVATQGPGSGFSPAHVPNINLANISNEVKVIRESIREFLYANLFLMVSGTAGGERTATEVYEIQQEKLIMLGPVIERLQPELLAPVIEILYDIMDEDDLLPEVPDKLDGVDLRLEMVSLFALAQRLSDVQAIEKMLAFVGGTMQLEPESGDKLDFDQAIDEYGLDINVPSGIVVSDKIVAQKRAARDEALKMQQMGENMATASKSAKDLSEASMDGNTALSTLAAKGGGPLGG